MSRCFPFPPPGYVKKARPDDADLLKKEKPREKKHKKEKKDKEKREGKEKKEKDKSDGKHREKKDKKEKHWDKKKEKEKDRDKDREKSSTSEEKRVARQLDVYNREKLYKKEERVKEKSSTSEEKRVGGQFEGCNGEKLHQKEERGKRKNSTSNEEKLAVQLQGHNGEHAIRNSLLAKETEDSKFVLELDRRIRDEEKGTACQLVDGFTVAGWKKDEGIDRIAVRDTGMLAEDKEKNKDKRVDNRKMAGQRFKEEERFSGNAMAQDLTGMVPNKVEGMPRPMEKMERTMEGKEKSNEREGDKREDKSKNKDREKKNHGKDKDREKEKKKEKSERKKTEKVKSTRSNKNDLIVAFNNVPSHLSKDCEKNAATEGNLKKRKDMETNGFMHDNELRPNKLPRPTRLFAENGKKLEPFQAPNHFTSDRQEEANNLKVENMERKVNGVIAAQPLPVSITKPSPAITHQIAEASRKPPHPDSKYLSQVLSVPHMEEWSDFDDQEWLFSCKDPPLKKPDVGSVGVNEQLRVWDEALQIESADVYALPYVIPY